MLKVPGSPLEAKSLIVKKSYINVRLVKVDATVEQTVNQYDWPNVKPSGVRC